MRHERDAADDFLTKQGRSGESFVRLYEAYSPLTYTIALKLLNNQRDAEDLVQDVFIEIYNHPDQFEASRGSVKTWIAVKTRSRCLDRLRKKDEIAKDQLEIESRESIEEEVMTKMEWEKAKSFLANLPENQRKAVIGNYLYDQSHAQLAATMKKPLGTVKSWIRQGLDSLQKQWSGQETKRKDKNKHDM